MGIVHAKSENVKNNNFQYDLPKEPSPRHDYTSQIPHYRQGEEVKVEEIVLDRVQARVDKIHVDGLARTKNDIVEDCIRDLFKATNFQEVLLKANQTRLKLDELGCFKNIGIFIDTSKGAKASPDGVEITFDVKEHSRLAGSVSTHVGNNEGALLVGLRTPNLFGRGERIKVEYTYGAKKTTNFDVAFIKPFRGKHRPTLTTSIFQSNAEWQVSGYKQLDRGLLVDLGFYSIFPIKHNLQWEGTVRDLSVLSRNTSFDVREQAGLTLKSAIKHIFSVDFRDDFIFPSQGHLIQFHSEISGLGGNVGYLKNDFFLQTNHELIEDIVLQLSLSGGYMRGLNNDMKINLSDMYYLGGPLTVRGFQMRGIGPHSEGNALGSLSYWSSGLHLFTPLPFRPGRGGFGELFRTHFFLTCGNIGNFTFDSKNSILETLTNNLRMSYGLGVALRLGNAARVELNYCVPIYYEKGDRVQPGIQFGIGVQFL